MNKKVEAANGEERRKRREEGLSEIQRRGCTINAMTSPMAFSVRCRCVFKLKTSDFSLHPSEFLPTIKSCLDFRIRICLISLYDFVQQ